MKKNLIILTHGWTGSSVFASLLASAGYSLGPDTVKKPDYDTGENTELVALNRQLLKQLAPSLNHEHCFDDADVELVANAARRIDLAPFRRFVDDQEENRPWLWKDPRLTWTIRVWAELIDLDSTAFLVLTRDDMQAWISSNQRRHVQSLAFTRQYNHGITRSNLRFLEMRHLPHIRLSFEDLLLSPEATLDRLNNFLGLQLTLADLERTCRSPLHRRNRSWIDFAEAALVYLKNYRERDGRRLAVQRPSPLKGMPG